MQYNNYRKVFRIGTVCYNWPMSAHASQVVMLRFGFIDFDSIFRSTIRSRFDSVSIFLRSAHLFWPKSIRVWPRGNGSAAVLATHEAIPHRCCRRRLEQGRCWVGKYRSNSVVLWHGAEAAKLDSATAHTHSIHCFSSMGPVSIVRCANQPYSSK